MSGLFEKALALLKPQQVLDPHEEIVFDEESGISKEDQKEILKEIETAASRNKLSAGPEAFIIKAEKRGVLLPLLVNALAVVLLAAGGFILYFLFQRGESTLKEEAATITSAEGRLIAELKKESEEKLLEKNREISQIQGRLVDIDRERRDLQTNMDAKVQAREQELRQALDAELAAAREKLRQQGISEEDINRRLGQLEAQKTAEFLRQLETYKQEAEEERTRAENNLKALQDEYQANLAKASEERQRVLEDSRKREAELKNQLDTKTKALEAESREARQELSRISEQREKEQLASGQLIGFYNRVKGDIQSNRLDQALKSLEGIKEYLNDPSIVALPSMLQRRELEFFVVDSISSLVKSEMKKTEVDTSSLIASANLVTEMKSRVLEGDGLYAKGEIAEAEKKYNEALALMPEVNKSHRYFLERESSRQAQLSEFLQKAQSSFAAKDYSGSLDHYARALAFLPEDPVTIERIIAQVRQSGYELGLDSLQREDSAGAAAPLAEADRLYTQGRYAEALPAYIDLLAKHPNSSQASSALQGIDRSVDGLNRQSEAGLSELQKRLQEKVSEAEGLEASLSKKTEDTGGAQRSLEERAGKLEQELKDKVSLIESLQQEKKMLSDEIESLKKTGAAAASQLDEALKQKLARLEKIESNYSQIVESYRQYAAREDTLLSAKPDAGLVEAKLHLNAFLASTEDTFPGLWTRIKRYDSAFEMAGRTSAVEDVNDILYELTLRGKPQERQQFLAAEIQRRKDDSLMISLLQELKGLQGGGPSTIRDISGILKEVSLRRKPEAKQLYLESAIVKNRNNPEMVQLLEDLLELASPEGR